MYANETDSTIDVAVKTKQQQFLERTIHRWQFLLTGARAKLHAQDWSTAIDTYQDAHALAEFLVHIHDCKNCAIKNYVRTLIEYGYILCKSGRAGMLSQLIELAHQTLLCYTTPRLAEQLLKPVLSLVEANNWQRDLWINQLFAGDAVQHGIVH